MQTTNTIEIISNQLKDEISCNSLTVICIGYILHCVSCNVHCSFCGLPIMCIVCYRHYAFCIIFTLCIMYCVCIVYPCCASHSISVSLLQLPISMCPAPTARISLSVGEQSLHHKCNQMSKQYGET